MKSFFKWEKTKSNSEEGATYKCVPLFKDNPHMQLDGWQIEERLSLVNDNETGIPGTAFFSVTNTNDPKPVDWTNPWCACRVFVPTSFCRKARKTALNEAKDYVETTIFRASINATRLDALAAEEFRILKANRVGGAE